MFHICISDRKMMTNEVTNTVIIEVFHLRLTNRGIIIVVVVVDTTTIITT